MLMIHHEICHTSVSVIIHDDEDIIFIHDGDDSS